MSRLYVLQARDAARAVVFRRGPSKRVMLVAWDTKRDIFTEGQWLNGRIYERRCDLSPDGRLLVYFAASWRLPYQSWTAISVPPFLTALALWPKGDGWGGGGLFSSDRELQLNHRENEMTLAAEFRLPPRLRVVPFGSAPGWGEDNPIWFTRLLRDGWKMSKDACDKPHPRWPERYELRMRITGIGERNGPWWPTRHVVLDAKTGDMIRIGASDWADWSPTGDLLFARDGCLFRLRRTRSGLPPLAAATKLIDLRDRTFRAVSPPQEAARWPTSRSRSRRRSLPSREGSPPAR